MSIEIKEVKSKREIKKFVKVPFPIFKGNDMWIPRLIREEMEIFDPKKNPAFENAEARLFIAYRDGKPVGRVAAILSHIANEKFETKNIRFGWLDMIEDYEVAKTLLDTVAQWGKELGMETMTGPHGFCDFDPEGMLVEGFDQLPVNFVIHNYPYYVEFCEKYGLEKDVDYVELKTYPPYEEGIPPKLLRLGERIKERSNVRVVKFNSKKELMAYADDILKLLDEEYKDLYGVVPLSDKQIQYYVRKYFPFVDKDLVKVAVNEKNEVVGFLITMPSLSRAFQKAKGRLLPFGWYHILIKAMKNMKILDFYLAGIKKKYQGQGIDLLMVLEIVDTCMDMKIEWAESTPELESNKKIQAQWKYFNPILHKRRRIYKKNI